MRLHAFVLLPLMLICGCCSSDEAYSEPPPPPPEPAAIAAQTKSLGPAEFIPAIEVTGGELKVNMRFSCPNRMNRRGEFDDFDVPGIVYLELLDSRGQPLACATPTKFMGEAGSLAMHGRITRTFGRPEHRKDIKQLRLLFDDIQLTWEIHPRLIAGFELRPAQTPSQAVSPDDMYVMDGNYNCRALNFPYAIATKTSRGAKFLAYAWHPTDRYPAGNKYEPYPVLEPRWLSAQIADDEISIELKISDLRFANTPPRPPTMLLFNGAAPLPNRSDGDALYFSIHNLLLRSAQGAAFWLSGGLQPTLVSPEEFDKAVELYRQNQPIPAPSITR